MSIVCSCVLLQAYRKSQTQDKSNSQTKKKLVESSFEKDYGKEVGYHYSSRSYEKEVTQLQEQKRMSDMQSLQPSQYLLKTKQLVE